MYTDINKVGFAEIWLFWAAVNPLIRGGAGYLALQIDVVHRKEVFIHLDPDTDDTSSRKDSNTNIKREVAHKDLCES